MKLLTGKVAVITGANRGIGLSIARTFLENGAEVFACMRNSDRDIGSLGGLVRPVSLDLGNDESIKLAVKDILSQTQKVDILINNAGIASGGVFQMTSISDLRQIFEVNFFGQILFSQSISRIMARRKHGSIVNITSTAAEIPDLGTMAYGASKAALGRATKSMASELGMLGIRVNGIAPGVTKTDMYEQMDVVARDKLVSNSALKRVAEPQDVANAALFFASDLSSHITGQILRVDGGII